MCVNPKIGVVNPPKMDGEHHGKPPIKTEDLEGFTPPLFLVQHLFLAQANVKETRVGWNQNLQIIRRVILKIHEDQSSQTSSKGISRYALYPTIYEGNSMHISFRWLGCAGKT